MSVKSLHDGENVKKEMLLIDSKWMGKLTSVWKQKVDWILQMQ